MYQKTQPDIIKKGKHMTKCCVNTKNKCIDTLVIIDKIRMKLNDICEDLEKAVNMAEENMIEDEDMYVL